MITERQRNRHHLHLGSSDMAAVLGLNPWRSPVDVWLAKTQRVPPTPANGAMLFGTYFEPGVIQAAEDGMIDGLPEMEITQAHNERRVPLSPILDHHDGRVVETGEPVEIKTVGLRGPVSDQWGAIGTGEVPPSVYVQCHVHLMALPKSQACWVITADGSRGFAWFRVDRNEEVCGGILHESRRFWKENVEADVCPEGSASLDLLKQVKREPGSIMEVPGHLIQDWISSRELRLKAEREEGEAMVSLLQVMGDCEAAKAGGQMVTYMPPERPVLRVKQVKQGAVI